MTDRGLTLLELAALVDRHLAAIEVTKPVDRSDKWAWRSYHERARDLLAELVRGHGGNLVGGRGAYSLQLAGITATSAVSEIQLLKNWTHNVRKGEA